MTPSHYAALDSTPERERRDSLDPKETAGRSASEISIVYLWKNLYGSFAMGTEILIGGWVPKVVGNFGYLGENS